MISTTFGDMAQTMMLRRVGTGAKRAVTELSQEVTTGRVSDQARRVSGEFGNLADITARIALAETHRDLGHAAGTRLAMQQTVIGGVKAHTQDALASLALLELSPGSMEFTRSMAQMETRFRDVVTQFNTGFAGTGLFAGASARGVALASADTILNQIMADLDGSLGPNPDADMASQFIDIWFAPGGVFDTVGYLGDAPAAARLGLGNGLDVGFTVTAAMPEIRNTLAALAKGAALSRGLLADSPSKQSDLVLGMMEDLASAQVGLVGLGAQIGQEEWRAAEAVTRAGAEATALGIAQSELLAADPYDTATRLELARTQLDLIYALTARLSRLTLLDHLR